MGLTFFLPQNSLRIYAGYCVLWFGYKYPLEAHVLKTWSLQCTEILHLKKGMDHPDSERIHELIHG